MKKLLMLVLMILLVSSVSATIPNPGHPASQTGGDSDADRTFYGTSLEKFTFPGLLEINGTLNASAIKIGLKDVLTSDNYTIDTNETTRVDAVVGLNCSSGYFIQGRWDNGTAICVADDSGSDSGKQGSGYLYNDSTTMYLNESMLNDTIDARETDTNETTRMGAVVGLNCSNGYFVIGRWNNGTAICAADNSGTDTKWSINTTVLRNESGTLGVNVSFWDGLFARITNLVSYLGNWSADKADYYNKTEVDNLNGTWDASTLGGQAPSYYLDDTNESVRMGAIVGLNCSAGYFVIGRWDNGTAVCAADDSGTDSGKLGSGYLYNDSETMYLNETMLNATIDARDNDTVYDDSWINNTIDQKDVIANTSMKNYVDNLNGTWDAGTLGGQAPGYYLDDTNSNCSADGSCPEIVYASNTSWKVDNASYADDSSQLGGQLPSYYLDDTNESTRVGAIVGLNCSAGYFVIGRWNNGTAICAADNSGTDTKWSINTTVLRNESGTLGVNVSFWDGLFARIADLVGYVGNWSSDKSDYYNKTEVDNLNGTWDAGTLGGQAPSYYLDDSDTQKKADDNYLYNDSDTIYFNESKLNATIDARENDTKYTNASFDLSQIPITGNVDLMDYNLTNVSYLGVGTTNPTEALTVDGNISVNNAISSPTGNVIIIIGT